MTPERSAMIAVMAQVLDAQFDHLDTSMVIAEDLLDRQLAALPGLGLLIVPVVPTYGLDAMSGAGADNLPSVEGVYGHARRLACRVWTAMCAAAPNTLGRIN